MGYKSIAGYMKFLSVCAPDNLLIPIYSPGPREALLELSGAPVIEQVQRTNFPVGHHISYLLSLTLQASGNNKVSFVLQVPYLPFLANKLSFLGRDNIGLFLVNEMGTCKW